MIKGVSIILFALGLIGFLKLSEFKSNQVSKDYGFEFNKIRAKYGLHPIENDWEVYTLKDWNSYPSTSYKADSNSKDGMVKIENSWKDKWGFLLSHFGDIEVVSIYENENHFVGKPYLFNKYITYATNIPFWKNSIKSERDTYSMYYNFKGDEIIETFEIEHFFSGMNQWTGKSDTSFTVYNFSKWNSSVITCGEGYIEIDSIRKKVNANFDLRNIPMPMADSIMTSWKITAGNQN